MEQRTINGGSGARAPDLDWSQVNETVRMLNLAVAQIAIAMHEGDDSVESLTSSFMTMVTNVNEIGEVATRLGSGIDTEKAQTEVLSRCADVQSRIQHSIVAFQFYDRLSQRLEHVRGALEALSELVSDRSRLFNPLEWEQLQAAIRSRYTMEVEQQMFEVLLAGASIDEALAQVRGLSRRDDADDVELF